MWINNKLAPCPGFGWQGGPRFLTEIKVLRSGKERRNGLWMAAQHFYTAPFNNVTVDAARELRRMFYAARGRLNAFRFRDEIDYQADDETFGVGDGATLTFQLGKYSVVEGIGYFREVFAPAPGAAVFVNGDPATAAVDILRGLVTFASAPALNAVLSWTGEFDVWVRFDQDELVLSLDNPNTTNGSVTVVECDCPPVTP